MISVTVEDIEGNGATLEVIDKGYHDEELQIVALIRKALNEKGYNVFTRFNDET